MKYKSSGIFFLIISIFGVFSVFAEGIQGLRDFQYWENGKVRSCTLYDTNGNLKAKAFCRHDNGTVEKIEKYDRYGNKVEESLYDQKGRLKRGIDGWAAMKWWYDGPNLASQATYDEDGRPIERKHYSESGRLVYREYRDDVNFNPYEEANMALLLGARNMSYHDPRVDAERENVIK